MNGITYGESATRREDRRFITGGGRYTDDIGCAGALSIAFVRSQHPSARIRSIDVADALAQDGVVSVLTHADMVAMGFRDRRAPFRLPQGDGSFAVETPRPFLVRDRVRFIGEPVAMVLAESNAAALEAAERVNVEYEELPSVVDALAAAKPDAPRLWDDRPGNIAYSWRHGDMAKVDAALAASHHVARLKSHVTRVSAMPMEPRAALAYIGGDGRPVLEVSHQSPHALRNDMATLFGVGQTELRVLAGDVGGSFGMKMGSQREEILVLWAAMQFKRAVRWTALRTEAFLADEQGRDVHVTSELGLDATGRFTALRVRYDVNVGAYMCVRSSSPINNIGGIAGVYATPLIAAEIVAFFSNTQATAAYRGAGRPEATYAIERVIDVAAAEMGIDPAELRRRNLIPPKSMPFKTPFIFEYDCGEFERNLDKALELSRYASFPERREEARQRNRLRGIGIAMPIELAGKVGADWATVSAHADGSVTLHSGSMSVGQGLDTALSTLVAQRLGLPLSHVNYRQGDTDDLVNGKGNGGSSALIMGGTAIMKGVDQLIERGQQVAAERFEVAAQDVLFSGGEFRVAGTDRALSLADIAREVEAHPRQGLATLAGSGHFAPERGTFPNGCHVCEVEIDPDTGVVSVASYVSVEDVGRVLNPMLVEGQIHGGVAQGIGQALLEEIRFDETGQAITGSFMDYAMPRADDLPGIVSATLETPTALNPLGVKGVGEAGTVGALAATSNAVCNALQAAGIVHLDMPATPGRVWRALQEAGHRQDRG